MNTNINCFTLINNACNKLKGNFWRAFLGALVVVAPLVAVSFIPYYIGVVLAVFASGYLFYGLIIYYKKLLNGEKPSLLVIFTNYKRFGAATLIGIINVACLLVGLILLLFPSLAYMVYYCVNLHILADQQEVKVKECFTDNSNRMVGNKTLALSYKVLCYFLFALVAGVTALVFMPIVSLSATNYALAIFLGILVVLVAIALLSFVNVLYQATQLEFYNNCLPTMEYCDNYRKERNEQIIAKRNAKLNNKKSVEEKSTEAETEPVASKSKKTTKEVDTSAVEEKTEE